MVRAATNNIAALLPEGTSLVDAPHDLVAAVAFAQRILNWQENMLDEDRPPRWMWFCDHDLDDWFEALRFKRLQNNGGSSDSEPEGPMIQNELTRGLKGR